MLLGFKRRFAPHIEAGRKTHTIRGKRKRPPRVGEICHCYVDPRQRTMRLLGRWPCIKVEHIEISADHEVEINGVRLSVRQRESLARRDGFTSFAEMMQFWKGRLPFTGDIIHWEWSPS